MLSKKKSKDLINKHCLVFFLFGLLGYWHCGHSWPIVQASRDSEDDCGYIYMVSRDSAVGIATGYGLYD
jgi:hypothetical protein